MIRALLLAATMLAAAPASAQLSEQVDLKKPERPVPAAGEAMVVIRPWAAGMAGDNRVILWRLDPATGKPALGPEGKPAGVKLTYSYSLFGGKKNEKALRVAILPAGDYVLAARTFNGNYTDVFCFGAPRFTVSAGDIAYLGDLQMHALAKMPDGQRRNAMAYTADLEGARATLAEAYPALAPRLAAWRPVNGQRLPCIGDEFTAYDVPGAPHLPPEASAPVAAPAAAASTGH